MRLLFWLRQRKFVSTFWALSHFAVHGRGTARTSKCSAIGYLEGEPAFRTMQYVPRLRTHSGSLSLKQPFIEILKTFLEMLKPFTAQILTTPKTIKYYNSNAYEIVHDVK